MSAFLRKYNTATHVYVPLIKRGAVDFAVGADWTPASGDVKVSKDGGAAANIGTLPSAIAMGNGAYWDFTLTGTEVSAAKVVVTIADSATKAVEDQCFVIETYGNASAQHPFDLSTATQPVNVTQFGGSNGTFASGRPEVNTSHIAGASVSTSSAQIGVNVVNAGGTAWATVVTNLVSSIWAAVTDSSGVTTLLSRLSATRAGYLDNLSAGAVATASALTSVAGDVTTLLGRITSSLFSGITSLAQWLGAMAGKQTGNSTARTEIRATGAGSGTFDETTDSQEAIRDRGDAAWTTATGFSTLDAAGVRTAVGLASANLDSQLSSIASDAGDAKTAAEAVQTVTDNLPDGGALTSLATASALSTTDGKIDTLTTRLGAPADFGGGQSIAENLQDIVGSPTFDASTDSLEALRNRGDSAWTTADVSGLATSSALATVDSVVDAIKTTTDKLDDTLEDNSGTYRFTDDALAEAPTGGSAPTASEIADAVWDEDLTGHTTPDSAGDTLGSVATGTPPTAAAIADAVLDEALSGHTTAGTLGKAVADTLTDAAAILDDTGTSGVVVAAGSKTGYALTSAYDAAKTAAQAGDEMDLVDTPNATAVAAIQDGLSTQASVDDLPTNAELATALAGADDAVLAAIAALHNLSASDVRTAIGLASANLDTQLSTIAGYLDTEIASIISTLSTIGTAVTAIQAKSDNLPSDPADQSAVEAAIASAQSTITAAIDALNDLSAAAAAAGILDAADGIETGLTLRQAMRLVTAASAGKVSGADTSTVTIRNVGDTKNRVVATVDESGNRTAVTTDVS